MFASLSLDLVLRECQLSPRGMVGRAFILTAMGLERVRIAREESLSVKDIVV
jgi:hypothetical protein